MTGSIGTGYPIESKWVAEADLTTELLSKICTALPRAMFGGVIGDYQDKEIPKFISDLHMHYPEIFALLPDEQKVRLASVSYVGRKADITTCRPGKYIFSKTAWAWDGEYLIGSDMIFQPVKGQIEIKIKPLPGETVTITDNAQIGPNTRFVD